MEHKGRKKAQKGAKKEFVSDFLVIAATVTVCWIVLLVTTCVDVKKMLDNGDGEPTIGTPNGDKKSAEGETNSGQ